MNIYLYIHYIRININTFEYTPGNQCLDVFSIGLLVFLEGYPMYFNASAERNGELLRTIQIEFMIS